MVSQVIVTDIAYRASVSWQSNGKHFTAYLSLTTNNPTGASDLTECGRSTTDAVNDERDAVVHCIRPMRSLYVMVEVDYQNIVVCEFYVYSSSADYLL